MPQKLADATDEGSFPRASLPAHCWLRGSFSTLLMTQDKIQMTQCDCKACLHLLLSPHAFPDSLYLLHCGLLLVLSKYQTPSSEPLRSISAVSQSPPTKFRQSSFRNFMAHCGECTAVYIIDMWQECFSNFNAYVSYLGTLLKYRFCLTGPAVKPEILQF